MNYNIQSQQKFSFDLGKAFPTMTSYLTTSDKLALAATCRLLNHIIFRSDTWHQLNIHDHQLQTQWPAFLVWVRKYIDIIQPTQLSISILDQSRQDDKELMGLFLKARQYINKVEIRCSTLKLHLFISNSCPNITKITFHSATISDSLLESMLKHCPHVKEIEITADSLEFTGNNIAGYLKNPLQSLRLRPYLLNFQAILELVLNSHLNQLSQLQIDVEECPECILEKITSQLPNIRRLRLFHMERFNDPQKLAQNMSKQMIELTLTKCYNLELGSIISRIVSSNLQKLDLTEALFLNDNQILMLADHAINLKHLNISWCKEITNKSLREIANRCERLQFLCINGVKALDDQAFQQYNELKSLFNQKLYDEIRFQFKKLSKKNKANIDQIYDKLEPRVLRILPRIQHRTLPNLRHLECISCNNISDKILKIIYCSNRKAQVTNYYGEVLSLYYSSQYSENQYS